MAPITSTNPISAAERAAAAASAPTAPVTGGEQTGTSFAAYMQDATANAVDKIKAAEAMSVAGIKGEATAHEVVSAVMEAEQSLKMMIAIRDRAVAAYAEIARMQI